MKHVPVIEGEDWRSSDEWPVLTVRDVVLPLSRDFGASYHLHKGRSLLGLIEHSKLTLKSGYACDGFSPVVPRPWWMPGKDRWLRLTPTPKCGIGPALGHDILRQFLEIQVLNHDGVAHEDCPWDREYTDDEFYNWMAAGGVSRRHAGLYHEAVAGVVGTLFIALTRKPDKSLSIVRHEYQS